MILNCLIILQLPEQMKWKIKKKEGNVNEKRKNSI